MLFLGGVPAGVVQHLAGACDGVVAAWPPFEIDVAAGGGRVQHGDGVAWLWVRGNARGIIDLAEDLERAIGRAVTGLPEPRRAQSAHLTVARRADRPLIGALRDETHGPLRAMWVADRVALMRSHLGRSGAQYEVVHEVLLTGPLRA